MTTDMQAELKRIASELRAYNPAADEYKGEHIHKVWAREIEAALTSRPDAKAESGAWRTGTPPVPEGKCREFILAVRRAQSNAPGKVFVFSANYANEFTDDGCLYERNGEEIFVANGWHLCALDASGEFNEVYEAVTLNEGDEILGWQELPKWDDARATAPQATNDPDAVVRLKAICKALGLKNAIPEETYADPGGLFMIFGMVRAKIDVLLAPQAAAQGVPAIPVELSGVKDAIETGDGFWRSCSGCHETNEGAETGHYPYSQILDCYLGAGCSECGGIGAVWDDTDYGAMADAMMASTNAAPSQDREQGDDHE